MPKITYTPAEDQPSIDFFPQSYTDSAISDALANHPNNVAPDVAEVDLQLTDGSTKKFVAAQ